MGFDEGDRYERCLRETYSLNLGKEIVEIDNEEEYQSKSKLEKFAQDLPRDLAGTSLLFSSLLIEAPIRYVSDKLKRDMPWSQEVKLKEGEHRYEVVNLDDFDLGEYDGLTGSSGKRITQSRKEFEERIKEEYRTNNIVWVN